MTELNSNTRRQLNISLKALERAQELLTAAADVIPADELANACAAGAADALEGVHFIRKALEAGTAPSMAIVVETGTIYRIFADQPVGVLVVNHDIRPCEQARVFNYEDPDEGTQSATVSRMPAEIDRRMVDRFAEADRTLNPDCSSAGAAGPGRIPDLFMEGTKQYESAH